MLTTSAVFQMLVPTVVVLITGAAVLVAHGQISVAVDGHDDGRVYEGRRVAWRQSD